MSSYGIKESLEALDGVKILAVEVKEIIEGGIELSDLEHLVDLAKRYGELEKAFKGLGDVPKEMGDLDESEASQLLAKVFEILRAIKGE